MKAIVKERLEVIMPNGLRYEVPYGMLFDVHHTYMDNQNNPMVALHRTGCVPICIQIKKVHLIPNTVG